MVQKEDGKAIKPRQVAVAIPFHRTQNGEIEICLISSRKHEEKFVLPKGGIEKDEKALDSAIREMWEEAGLKPKEKNSSLGPIGSIDDHKPHKHSSGEIFIPRATYTAFLIEIEKADPKSEFQDWPEKDERKRVWMNFDQACNSIKWRKDIFTLLKQSQSYLM